MMRCFLLVFSFIFLFVFMEYQNKITNLEVIVFKLYERNFEDYLCVDNYGNLTFNNEKIKSFIEEKGYKVTFDSDTLKFTVSFKFLFGFKKTYEFLLEKNYEFQ